MTRQTNMVMTCDQLYVKDIINGQRVSRHSLRTFFLSYILKQFYISLEKFQKSQQSIGTNEALVVFMADALQFFDGMPKEEIKKITFEIAMHGTQCYRPDKDDYRINSIKGKTFSGYHILAYYHVSWALAIPEMLSRLQLPYDDYKLALTMHKPNK